MSKIFLSVYPSSCLSPINYIDKTPICFYFLKRKTMEYFFILEYSGKKTQLIVLKRSPVFSSRYIMWKVNNKIRFFFFSFVEIAGVIINNSPLGLLIWTLKNDFEGAAWDILGFGFEKKNISVLTTLIFFWLDTWDFFWYMVESFFSDCHPEENQGCQILIFLEGLKQTLRSQIKY